MRRFYSSAAANVGDTIELSGEETRHLRDVLRLGVGDEVSVFDGAGREFACVVSGVDRKSATLTIQNEIEADSPESPLELTVASTIIPGDRYDLIVQKSVELGVATFLPIVSIRSEVKLADAGRRIDRWRRIALEATKQCGRARLMNVAEPREFANSLRENAGLSIMFSERDGAALSSLRKLGKQTTIFYGPKGGWDDKELAMARESGVQIITLGGRILRAETAAIAITAILQHRFGDMN